MGKTTGLKDPPLQGARGIGVEVFFVEEEDAGAEGEEHDGEAGGDAEAGGDGGRTVVATADDDVAGDGYQEFQNAAFEQPGDEAGDHCGGIAEIEVEKDSPDQPECRPKEQEVVLLVEELIPEVVAANSETQGPNHGRGKKSSE